MIFESSNVSAFKDFHDKYRYIRDQGVYFIIGVIGLIVTSFIPYKKYYYWSLPLLLFTIVSLFAVFIPGIGIGAYGANRWISLGSLNFQPAELAKLSLVLYLSAWFSSKEKGRFTSFLLLTGMIVGLVILEPDLGTAVILMCIAMIVYFLSGAPFWHFAMLIPSSILAGVFFAISSPYRMRRLTTFLRPEEDPLGASYHIRQILLSLGSGGLFGMGLGASRQKYQFLPEATTDSIFGIIGEEFGFIGAVVLLIVFAILLYKIAKVAKSARDKYGFLLGGGILALFGCQIAINLGAIVAILPLTGVPLPFISYGGSNLIVSLIAIGILINVSKNGSTIT